MIFIFIGLNLSEHLENFTLYTLFWIVYSLVAITFVNIYVLGHFWSVIRKKSGPPGIRGPRGDRGIRGEVGKCDIDTNNSICMVELNTTLDELHKKHNNNKTILVDRVLINGFMQRKITSICKSIQFDMLSEILINEGKELMYLISYLKGIIKEWFHLIYEQNENWFLDADASVSYDWKNENPFNEIKKYDIYYWGDTRRFKPLKNKICKVGLDQNTNLPQYQDAKLKMIRTNDYNEIYDDTGSQGSRPIKIFRPKEKIYLDEGYYPIGDVVVGGQVREGLGEKKSNNTIIGDLEYEKEDDVQNGPDKETILITGDITDPQDYELMWRDQKYTNSYIDEIRRVVNNTDTGYGSGRLWKPIGKPGYTCLGDVATKFYPPNHPNRDEFLKYNKEVNVKCIPTDCVEQINEDELLNNKTQVWKADNETNDIVYNGEIYSLNDEKTNEALNGNSFNVFRADNLSFVNEAGDVITKRGDKFYRIKQNCFNPQKQQIKEVEPQYEEIGIGWYGNPSNSNPKYSIYDFMGLVPEGVITHQVNNKKYYIVHYGGTKFNCFNILIMNPSTGKYDNSLQMGEVISSGEYKVNTTKLIKSNKKQQWKIVKKDEFIYFESIQNGKILHILDNNYFSLNIHSVNSYFSFTPAFGTGIDDI